MMTDTTRLQQILKNLLSNAFKFTSRGKVTLRISLMSKGWTVDHPTLSQADGVLAFAVTDSGVGIPGDKLQLIFEAFQQADGSTARRYGGTGLGLSISRELARLLGGEIRVESEVDAGSTFTLFLPYHRATGENDIFPHANNLHMPVLPHNIIYTPSESQTDLISSDTKQLTTYQSLDDRALTAEGDPAILIVEDDQDRAKLLLNAAREQNFKGIVTATGDSVLTLAREYLPSAILLKLQLNDIDGYAILERLKRDPTTRHIPVHIISNLSAEDVDAQTEERERCLGLGAISHLAEPINTERLQNEFLRIQRYLVRGKRNLLVVEDDQTQRDGIIELIGTEDVQIVSVTSGKEALDAMANTQFDCVVLDLTLPDMNGFDVLDVMSKDEKLRDLPVVVYTAKDLSRQEITKLKRIGKTVVVKDARSPERLLNETSLFLHRPHASMPEQQRRMIDAIQEADGGLSGRSVLIVDDDLRNIFALSSVLERQNMKVTFAENGRDGIQMLERDPSIEIVLMDIMMPEMDGYDTMRAIRKIPRFKSLPIITLTAKAMKGDRDKCIEAGASDYITKPVDVAQLLSLMRVWLH